MRAFNIMTIQQDETVLPAAFGHIFVLSERSLETFILDGTAHQVVT